jgi:hypothetical protein
MFLKHANVGKMLVVLKVIIITVTVIDGSFFPNSIL